MSLCVGNVFDELACGTVCDIFERKLYCGFKHYSSFTAAQSPSYKTGLLMFIYVSNGCLNMSLLGVACSKPVAVGASLYRTLLAGKHSPSFSLVCCRYCMQFMFGHELGLINRFLCRSDSARSSNDGTATLVQRCC